MNDLEQYESDFSKLLSQVPCDDQGRADHRDALRVRTLAALDAANRPAPAPAAWKQILNQGRELMRRPLPRLVLAASVCLAVVAIWLLVPGQQSSAQAFNMFAAALVNAKSATFQMKTTIEGQEKEEAQGSYLAPDKIREVKRIPGFVPMKDSEDEVRGIVHIIHIADMKTGKMVTLTPERKIAFVMDMKNRPNEPGKPRPGDIFGRVRDLLSERRNSKEDEYKRLGEKEIDGHHAVGFSYADPVRSLTLWGDPATGLPVLIETVWSGSPKTEVTMSHFELNEKLDPALFDTTPPADYKVQTFGIDASEPTETTLIDGLRLAAGWNDGQFIRLDIPSTNALVRKQVKKVVGARKDESMEMPPELVTKIGTIARGLAFAVALPESADAHYAVDGVKLGEPNRPIFWYKPEAAKTYRVIYADLSVKDAETAPEVAGAVRFEKTKPVQKQDN